MTHYESLAKTMFEHENSGPNCAIAPWEEQNDTFKAPYIRAAQVATIALHQHNTFDVSMVPIAPKGSPG